jgi:hypothetical protein
MPKEEIKKIKGKIEEILSRHENASLSSDVTKIIIAEEIISSIATIVSQAVHDYFLDFD